MSAVPPITLPDGVLREPGDVAEAVRPEYLISRPGFGSIRWDPLTERSPFVYLRSSMTAPTTSRES